MSLWRWERDPKVGFPPPTLRINKRRYWRIGVVRAWLEAKTAESGLQQHVRNGLGTPTLPTKADVGRAHGMKGAGEAGFTGAPGALVNAIMAALGPGLPEVGSGPYTPTRILELLRKRTGTGRDY